MNSASRTTRILTVLLLVAAIALSLPGTVLSQPSPPEVFVSPVAKVATTCATTTIAIGVKNVIGLTGYHLNIAYDAADLEITDVVNGGFLGEPVNSEFYEPSNSWATPGVISFGMVQQNTTEDPLQPRSGDGDLIIITLKARAANASTAITVNSTTSQLVNWPEALPIEFTVTNGLVTTESCAPTASGQTVSTAEDTAKAITLGAADPDSDLLTYAYSDPVHGTVTGSGPLVSYDPDANYHGPDSFTFTASDPFGKISNTATINITVTPVLDPPALSSIDLAGPYMAGLQQEFHVTLTNPSFGDAFSNVLARFRLEDITLADIASFEYLASAAPDLWLPLPLSQDAADVIGDFGPPTGFSLTTPYSATSSFRITFYPPTVSPTAHAASVTLYDLTPAPDVELANLSATVTVVEDLEVTGVTLVQSTDQTAWSPIDGTFDGGFYMPLLTTEPWYYLDAATLTVNRPLPDGLYPFNFDVAPDGFFAYWATQGVIEGASGWQGIMWQIINGDLPVFYLKVDAGSYMLVDGLSYELDPSTEQHLRINGNYWPGMYSFSGIVDDEYGFMEEIGVDITFDDIPLVEDQLVSTLEDLALDINLTALDRFNSGLVWEVLIGPAHGVLSGIEPALTYTPALNWHGTDSFTFKVTDGTLVSNIATVTIEVTPGNDNPDLGAIGNQSINELESLGFTAAATDIDGDTDFLFSLEVAASGTFPVGAGINPLTGEFAWTPDETQGPGIFTAVLKVCDAGLLCDQEEISISVAEVNSAPVLDTIVAQEIDEIADLLFTASTTDADIPANNLTYSLTGTVPAGAAITTDGGFTWTPSEDQGFGVYSFNIKVCDDGTPSLCDEKPVTVTVNEVNIAPVLAHIGDRTIDELVELAFTATATDADLPANTLTFSLANGTAGLVPPTAAIDSVTGAFSWTPDEREGGDIYTFDVCVSDGLISLCETIHVTVNEVNVAPVAQNDAYQTDEDVDLAVLVADGLLKNDTDSDLPGNVLTVEKVTDPAFGTLVLAADGSFTYAPNQDFLGSDSFTYKVFDGTVYSNIATVTLDVHTQNDAPVAVADTYTATEDLLKTVVVGDGLLINDTDVEHQTLTAQLVAGPASGILTLNPNGAFTYMPAANVNGPITFTYRTYDTMEWSLPATVTITIAAVDDPTVALDKSVTTAEDVAKTITLGVTEVDGNTLAWTVGTPAHGILSGTAPNLTYTPNPDTFGPDSFTFSVNDGTSQSNTATVSINVTSVNDAPIALDDTFTVEEDDSMIEAVTATDVDNDALTYSVRTAPVHGGLILGLDGAFAYQPTKNYSGSDSFTFYAMDGHGGTAWGTISITITPVNDAPIAAVDPYATNEDTLLTVTAPGVLVNDTDVDNASLIAVLLEGPSSGTFDFSNDGSFTYLPAENYHGTVTFTYMASDGVGNSSTTIDIINVAPVNDTPVLVQIDEKNVNELVNLAFTAIASDVDGGTLLTFSLLDQPAGATISAAGAFSWTPTEAQGAGSYTFTVKVCDNAAVPLCDTQELTVTVNEVNIAPTASTQAVTTAEDTAKGITLAAVDADGNPLNWTIVAQPQHGTLSGSAPALTYTPAADYFGADSFTFKVNDGSVDSNVATVTIDVTSVNDLPVAAAQTVTADFETAANITLGATDIEGDTLTWTIMIQPQHGTLSGDAPNLVYTPAAGYTGSDSFTFKVNDGTGDSNTATVTITIGEPPTFYIYLPLIMQ